MTLNEALRLAQAKGMDLIEVAPTATPPVCRIADYGKFLYEESKRNKDSHARQSATKMKELQISATIDPHDLEVKLSHAIEFLCDEMQVRVKLRFRAGKKPTCYFQFYKFKKLSKEKKRSKRVRSSFI